ncbi:MAG: tetratricopeptide repeat protein [Actinomycetota bacterium]|nr:tetratricopeptide repeat protein [Actinomycetota bacterium]
MDVPEGGLADSSYRGVFLSYRRDDSAGHAGRLADTLVQRFGSSRVFFDIGSIELGRDFLAATIEALARCSVVLALIGPRWLDARTAAGTRRLDDPDDYVRRELEVAFAHGVRLIPVLHSGCTMPVADDLPPSLRPLVRCNAFELIDRLWNESSQVIVDALAASIAPGTRDHDPAPASTRATAVPAREDASKSTRLALIRPAHNLPVQLTSFVGRNRERQELRALVEKARVVTVTGPGGVGKTRLSLETAGDLLEGTVEGVWIVELAPLAGSSLVASSVASALGVREQSGRPILETLIDALQDRRILIVLDNCEHVIETTANLADRLVQACPNVHILATSREPMGIGGEHVYRITSLSVPPADATGDGIEFGDFEAVRLFADRALQQRPSFSLDTDNAAAIASICRHLDGIPLAIELAAARTRSMTIDEIEQHLDERFRLLSTGNRTALPRHQTLRALVDWSYDLLDHRERASLCRLTVFAGGWDLDAARAVLADGELISEWEVIDIIGGLVDKSLVQAEPRANITRYRLLETIREYAAAHLAERGDNVLDQTRLRHRDHYLALSERASSEFHGPDQLVWLDRVAFEHDNVRGALATCHTDVYGADKGLRLFSGLERYWRYRGHAAEGVEHGKTALGHSRRSSISNRIAALVTLSELQVELGDYAPSAVAATAALDLARTQDDPRLLSDAMGSLGGVLFGQGEHARAHTYLSNALELVRECQDSRRVAYRLNQLANVVDTQGDTSVARRLYKESLDLRQAAGDHIGAALVINNLGCLNLAAGEIDAADALFRQVAITMSRSNQVGLSSMASVNVGLVAVMRRDTTAAREYLGGGMDLATQHGLKGVTALALLGHALMATLTGDYAFAASLHGAADELYERIGGSLDPEDAKLRAADHDHLRQQLTDDGFDTAYQRGRILSYADAIAHARAGRPSVPSSTSV